MPRKVIIHKEVMRRCAERLGFRLKVKDARF